MHLALTTYAIASCSFKYINSKTIKNWIFVTFKTSRIYIDDNALYVC